jgi:phospholipase/carboxylesterase
MARFFRRLAEGVFDEADLRRRAGDLAGFVAAARDAYGIEAPVAIGVSNGANIAAAVLMLHPDVLAGAALLRAMVPLGAPPAFRLAATPVLLLSGGMDPIVPAENAARLAAMLGQAGADLRHETLRTGHGLTQADVVLTAGWLRDRPAPTA